MNLEGPASSGEERTAFPEQGTLPSEDLRLKRSKSHIGTAETLPPPPFEEPSTERYALVRELGRGGMGRVDEVFDARLGRAVARKASLTAAPDVRATMLIAEAQTCAQLEHPAIVPVYDVGSDGFGQPYYTMRNVRGRTLGHVIDDNANPEKEHKSLAQMLSILRQVCLAVDYAHSRGVVHRDLKPDNVIVGEFGEVYVLDWGIAHVMGGSDVRRTVMEDVVAGSPGYMAPEQALGKEVDGRADVFALGAILYEILTGEVPFEDSDFRSIQKRAHSRLEVPPSRRNPLVATSFDTLVAACLEPEPADRLPSSRYIADAIDVYLDGERERADRERDAASYTAAGDAARGAFVLLDRESRRLREEAASELESIPKWDQGERKEDAWRKLSRARTMAAEAAHAHARSEAAFGRALARVEGYAAARKGLAGLYFRQFEEAEAHGESERMVQYLDLARTYDDGELALELADEGELVVRSEVPGARVVIARYEPSGLLLKHGKPRVVGDGPLRLASGSYLVTATSGKRELRYPLVVRRALRHTLTLAVPAIDVPGDLCIVPGGPFAGLDGHASHVGGFAMARFPVTLREYAAFLSSLPPEERDLRLPSDGTPNLAQNGREWVVTAYAVEGDGRKRIEGRELEIPAGMVSWYSALAYTRWLAQTTGLPYRLPTDLEWEKAMRGADARAFPMGNHIDPSFAKLRESRPEASQPEPVGAFALDESPYGVRDMAGGIGDWTSTMIDGKPAPALADEGTATDNREAVWRGGAWSTTASQHAPMRYTQMLHHRVGWVGFRVALSLEGDTSDLVTEPMKR